MTDIPKLTAAEARRWAAMHIDPARKAEFVAVAKRLVNPTAKARYLTVQNRTGVPWWVIAVIHEREASQNFNSQLGQGDPLHSVSRHVPAGRGPFNTWEDGAYDALVNCAPYAARWKDWSIGGVLVILEEYNGLGYANKGVPSPYDWSGTDEYRSGKYVRDRVYDPNAVDRQLGCAGLIACMAELDHDVHFDGTAPTAAAGSVKNVPVPHTPSAPQRSPVVTPAKPAAPLAAPAGNALIAVLNAIFKAVRALLAKPQET